MSGRRKVACVKCHGIGWAGIAPYRTRCLSCYGAGFLFQGKDGHTYADPSEKAAAFLTLTPTKAQLSFDAEETEQLLSAIIMTGTPTGALPDEVERDARHAAGRLGYKLTFMDGVSRGTSSP